MANISTSIIVVVLFWGLAVGTRTKLFTDEDRVAVSALASSDTDGICASMVLAQGYPCEEHTVCAAFLSVQFIIELQMIFSRRQEIFISCIWFTGDNRRWLCTQYAENSSREVRGDIRKQDTGSSTTWTPHGEYCCRKLSFL